MPPKRRNPALSATEKASITKVARDLAKEVNAEIEEVRKQDKMRKPASLRAERDRKNVQARRRRVMKRRGVEESKICAGISLKGTPCKLPTLLPETWDGPEEITGDYCLHHEPTIDNESRESFRVFGSSKRKVYRRVTPGELAHQLIQRSPHVFLGPYLKALGYEMDEEGELHRIGSGLKLYGYSRGGEVMKSRYPDVVGQVNVAEKLLDRVYGKARQAVDLAASSTSVSVHVVMDPDRVTKVADVLSAAGAFPNGNGNGHVIESTATDVQDDELLT